MRIKHFVISAILCVTGATVGLAHSAPPPAPNPPNQQSGADAKNDRPVKRIPKGSDGLHPVKRVPPHYPDAARAQHIEGTVRLATVIDTDGKVIEAKYVSGPKELVQASIDAIRQWRFKPTLLNGEAVQVQSEFEFNFQLGR
jgi:TonB family protein